MTSYETLKRHLEQKLIKYLNKYLKKDFKMNPIFKNLKRTLSDEEEITEKQFDAIIKFVEREKEWRGEPRGKIYKYFSPVISKSQDKLQTTSLEEFMN